MFNTSQFNNNNKVFLEVYSKKMVNNLHKSINKYKYNQEVSLINQNNLQSSIQCQMNNNKKKIKLKENPNKKKIFLREMKMHKVNNYLIYFIDYKVNFNKNLL